MNDRVSNNDAAANQTISSANEAKCCQNLVDQFKNQFKLPFISLKFDHSIGAVQTIISTAIFTLSITINKVFLERDLGDILKQIPLQFTMITNFILLLDGMNSFRKIENQSSRLHSLAAQTQTRLLPNAAILFILMKTSTYLIGNPENPKNALIDNLNKAVQHLPSILVAALMSKQRKISLPTPTSSTHLLEANSNHNAIEIKRPSQFLLKEGGGLINFLSVAWFSIYLIVGSTTDFWGYKGFSFFDLDNNHELNVPELFIMISVGLFFIAANNTVTGKIVEGFEFVMLNLWSLLKCCQKCCQNNNEARTSLSNINHSDSEDVGLRMI